MASNSQFIPQHIAIIPDGNRRWAKKHGLPAHEGHEAGYKRLVEIADLAFARGVKHLTGYMFSTENWSRTEEEVKGLMKLTSWIVTEKGQEFHDKNICIRILGSREGVDAELLVGFDELQRLTQHNTGGIINICFNYGGRRDIVEAVNQILDSDIKAVDEKSFGNWLSTKDIPDPDMVIRTSGELRLSNFLPWESAYSELYFTSVLWPDFSELELEAALAEYAARKRNFGT